MTAICQVKDPREINGNESINWHNKRNPHTNLPPFLTRQSHERSTLLRVAATSKLWSFRNKFNFSCFKAGVKSTVHVHTLCKWNFQIIHLLTLTKSYFTSVLNNATKSVLHAKNIYEKTPVAVQHETMRSRKPDKNMIAQILFLVTQYSFYARRCWDYLIDCDLNKETKHFHTNFASFNSKTWSHCISTPNI
jgi:hypothetical protein